MRICQINSFNEVGNISKLGEIPIINSRIIEIKSCIEFDKNSVWTISNWVEVYSKQKMKTVIFNDILRKRTFYAEIWNWQPMDNGSPVFWFSSRRVVQCWIHKLHSRTNSKDTVVFGRFWKSFCFLENFEEKENKKMLCPVN